MFKTLIKASLTSALLLSALLVPGLAQQGPSVDKASIVVWANSRMYYPKPTEGDQNRTAWLPLIDFRLNGPIEAGTNIEVDYYVKNKPWVKLELSPSPTAAGRTYSFNYEGSRLPDNKGTLETGPIGITIKAVNELSGLNSLLYKGTLDVKKFNPLDPKQFPNFKNKFEYYVDQDWRIPFAHLSGNWYDPNDINGVQHAPNMNLQMWFRGDNTSDIEAHLYYQGKHVSKAEGSSVGGGGQGGTAPYHWSRVGFWFSTVQGDSKPVIYYDSSEAQNNRHAFNLYSNPGDYEIKVLYKGELSRSIKFSVGPDGKIVDNGVSLQTGTFDSWTLPVKTLKMSDGKWNPNAWKTGAFYSNPVTGFAIP